MARGYLVRLGDGALGAGDIIAGPTIGFVTSSTIGTGSWTWSGTNADTGAIVTNNTDTGTYYEALDGNVYFVPDTDFASDLTSATVTTGPTYAKESLASSGDDTIEGGGADDVIYGGADTSGTDTGDDTIYAGAGQDAIYGGDGDDLIDTGAGADTAYGGDGNDTLHGDATSTATSNYEMLRWELLGGDGTDVSGGFSQDTGGMNVMVDINNDGNLTGATVSTDEQFTGFGFLDNDSSLKITGDNSLLDDETALAEEYPPTATISLVFTAEAGSGLSNEVSDVVFLINDIDSGIDGWVDQVTVNAYDANGNAVSVDIYPAFLSDTLSGQTVTAGPGEDTPDSQEGSAQVEIAGPVHYIEIIYTNDAEGAQDIWLTDVEFVTEPALAGDDADVLFGDAGDDTIYGGYGNDILDGGTGQDSIFGGGGNDSIDGGADNDRIEGNDGDDTITATSGRNVMFGNDGNDTLQGGTGTDVQYGGNQNDEMTGSTGDDSLYGGNGNDSLYGGLDDDRLTGGGGDDLAYGGTGIDRLYGQSGEDALYGGADRDTIDGGTGNDSLFGGDGNDTLIGNDGDDFMNGDAGDDTIYGGFGADLAYGGAGNDDIEGGDGDDTLYGAEGDDTIAGNDGNDLLGGNEGQDQLSGEAGNDDLIGGDDSDTLFGGFGDDTLYGGLDAAADTLFGGDGADSMAGGDGNDVLDGDRGNDIAQGESGDDTFILSNSFGDDIIVGGETGETTGDHLDASGVTSDLTLDLTAVTSSNPENGTLTDGTSVAEFSEIEQITLGSGNDTATTNSGDETIYGGAGDDTINGSAGNDAYFGGDDDDVLLGGFGNDVLSGDAGNDYLGVSSQGDKTAYGGTGNDTVAAGDDIGVKTLFGGEDANGLDNDTVFLGWSSPSEDISVVFTDNEGGTYTNAVGGSGTFAEFETVIVGTGNDLIDGSTSSEGVDVIAGGGDDSIIGSDFDDSISGGGGSDTIASGAGDDYIHLGNLDGQDTIIVADGDGDDTLQHFQIPTDNGDGTYTPVDLLDVTGLTNFDGSQVSIDDVTISQNASGFAVLSFPNGASLTFNGISQSQIDDTDILQAMGIPLENQTVEGTAGDDIINTEYVGDPEGDMVDNNDALDGSNDDLIEANGGNDTAYGGTGDDTVYGGDGNDSVIGEDGDDTLFGDAGDDFLNGVTGNDTLFGGAGNDDLESGDGNDHAYGDAGNDSVSGDFGDDHVYGGAGDDYVRGSFGNDTVYGGTGDDYVWGGYGDDVHVVEDDFGNDTYFGDSEAETYGDTLDLSAVTDDLTIDLTNGVPEIGSFTDGTSTATFEEIEHITLGGGTDTLILGDTSGSDIVGGFEAPTLNADGTYTSGDLLDVSALTSDFGSTPVNVTDVTVTDDGNGNAMLTFPGGENITLVGIAPADVNSPLALQAMGIPINDGIVEGTSGDDTIDLAYLDDPDGDQVDNDDAVLAGTSGNDDIILAGDGNDTVLSNDGDDSVQGEAGNDVLYGGDDNDALFGGAGDDTLDGNTGDDNLFGGFGDDTFAVNADAGITNVTGGENAGDADLFEMGDATGGIGATVTFDGAESGSFTLGTSTTGTFSEIEQINTSDFDDTLDASLNTNDLTVFANSGDDTLIGGTGNDTLHGESGNDTVSGGAGNDQVQGDAGNDSLSGDAGDDIIVADIGDDIIADGAGNDSVYAGAGDDTISVGSGNDYIDGAEGTDTIAIGDNAGDNMVFGGTGDTTTGDILDGTALTEDATVVMTGLRAGTLSTSTGTTTFDQMEQFFTGEGDDTFVASSADANIDTGGGNDTLTGGAGDDDLVAGSGNDTINIGNSAGSDSIDGGTGDDTLSFAATTSNGVDVTFTGDNDGSYADDASTSGTDGTFTGIEAIEGTDQADIVDATLDTDGVTLSGLDGEDNLTGGSGNDTIDGGDGDDVIFYGDGDNTVYGGAGDDYIDDLGGSEASGNDVIYGGLGNDHGYLGDNDDVLYGGDGDDTFNTGTGADIIYGGAGNDSIEGAAGDDTFYGGAGDTLVGSNDADTFVIDTAAVDASGGTLSAITIDGGSGGTDNDTLDLTGYVSYTGLTQTLDTDGNSYSGSLTVTDDQGLSRTVTFTEIETMLLPPSADALDGTVQGTSGADVVNIAYADADGDRVDGSDAAIAGQGLDDDIIVTFEGDDSISAGIGDDRVDAGLGDDTIFGDDGHDALMGGDGNDEIDGGAGDDLIVGDSSTVTEDLIVLLKFEDTGSSTATDSTGYSNDANYVNGAAPGGTGWPGSGANTGVVLDGIDDYVEIPNDPAFEADNGTVSIRFNAANTDEFQTLAARDAYGFGGGGHFRMGITEDGEIYARLQSDTGNTIVTSAPNLVTVGEWQHVAVTFGAEGMHVYLDGVEVASDPYTGGTTGNSENWTIGVDGWTSTSGTLDDPVEHFEGELDEFAFIDRQLNAEDVETIANLGVQVEDTPGDDTLSGGLGDDTIFAGSGDDSLYGGAHNDSLYGDDGNDIVYGGAGNDTIAGNLGMDTLYGGAGNDSIAGGDNDANFAGSGDLPTNSADLVYGGDGDDSIHGGDGADTLYGDAGNDTIDTTAKDSSAYGGTGDDHITGSSADDHLVGNTGSDTIYGEDGDDTITGGNGGVGSNGIGDNANSDDSLYGGAGNDSIHAGHGDDFIDGGSGNDLIDGYDDNDSILGGSGMDTIDGGLGNDTIDGGLDNDTILVHDDFGNDTVAGGDGFDTLDLSALSNAVSVVFSAPGAGTVTDTVTGDTIVFSEIEQLILTEQADTVDAAGDDGHTRIESLGGNDSINGSAGDDLYDDQFGSGTALDGEGNDTYYGNDGHDEVYAGNEDDELYGGAGADTLHGQAGNDYLEGGEGMDRMIAGEGNDQIYVAEGDYAEGNQGDDTFYLDDWAETNNQTITIDGGSDGTNGDTLNVFGRVDVQDVLDAATDDGTGSFSGSVMLSDGTTLNFSEIENIICFTPGTRIATPQGARPIESLAIGDLVVTRDHGLRPIRWIGKRTVPGMGKFAPVRLRSGVMPGLETDLLVSPQHRMLFQGHQAELLFGESEVLVPAKHLIDGLAVTQDDTDSVTYIHMMFDEHEIVFAEGAATESFHPGEVGMDAIADECREELFSIFPELRAMPNSYGGTARRCLRKHEAVLLRG